MLAFEDVTFADCVEEQLEIIFMRSDIDSAFTCHCIIYITKSEGGGFTEALFLFRTYWQFRL